MHVLHVIPAIFFAIIFVSCFLANIICSVAFYLKKPTFKKSHRNSMDNYRPVSVLPNMSQIFERYIFHQLNSFMFEFLSKYQCGFCKRPVMPVSHAWNWKSAIDTGKSFGALLTDLSKAFDSLSYGLLLAQLTAYGFSTGHQGSFIII